MTRSTPDLGGAALIGIDTSPFIYHLEEHPAYAAVVRPVFARIEDGDARGVTSSLTLLELLVQAYRQGETGRRDLITGLLVSAAGLSIVPLDLEIADRAAEVRGRHGLRTPVAIQVATALVAGADLFLTNDRDLLRVREIPVALVDDLRGPPGKS